MKANRIVPDGTQHFVASHLKLFCLPMSHKKDARLIWVKSNYQILHVSFVQEIYSIFLTFMQFHGSMNALDSMQSKLHQKGIILTFITPTKFIQSSD